MIKYKELRINRIIYITLLVITLFSLLAVVPCFAAEIRVDPTGTNGYKTIKLAYENSQAGDTIVVSPGTYSEDGFYILHPVTIMGDGTGIVNYMLSSPLEIQNQTYATFKNMTLELTAGMFINSREANGTITFINCTIQSEIKDSSTGTGYLSTNFKFIDCIFAPNISQSLRLKGSHHVLINNTIMDDLLVDTNTYPLRIEYCADSLFYHNNFTLSKTYVGVGSTSTEIGLNNTWYLNNFWKNRFKLSSTTSKLKYLPSIVHMNSTEPVEYIYNGVSHTGFVGNYWADYTGVDADNDGIGDTPYEVIEARIGGVYATDYYPLMAPMENYQIQSSAQVPEAAFSANVTSGTLPLSVQFTDQSTNTPTSWLWDFGDNSTATEQNPSHTYTAAGTYTVNLTVANKAGNDTETKTDYITVKEASSESGWLEFQKDSSNSGYTFSSSPTRDPKLLWQSLTSSKQEPCGSGGVNVPPLISGNKVFVTAGNASVWAFNKDTGSLLWSKELGGSLVQTATPALGDGKLFVPTLEGDLYALDPETGDRLWNTHVTDSDFECPITYYDHKLYIGDGLEGGNGTKYYYCYDDSGNLIWKHENKNTSGFIWSGAAVVGNYLVYPVFEGKLVCLEKDTGTLVDEVDFSKSSDVSFALSDPGMFRSSVTYANGSLYTSSERGQETGYCFKVGFNSDTGQFLNAGWVTSIGFSTSTPVVYNGRVYVGHGEHGESGSMFCLNDSDGSVIWETPVSGGVKSSPVVSIENGKPYIYFTEAIVDGSIYCLNSDGTLAWHYNPPADAAYTLQGASLSEDKVYYGTDNGYLYCIGQGEALSPVANFSSDKQTGSFPLTVSFRDTSFNANKFLWDFGDGNTSTEINPVHTYITAGNYTVTLTAKNENGEDTKIAKDYIYANKAATTWQVKNGESIQAAINAANSGDIIQVYSGEYPEVLTVNKTLTLKGIGDPVLNASGFKGVSGVTISADDVEFSGFKITGTEEMCFAISISAGGTLIEDNLIDDCAEGVWLTGTGNTLLKNNISNCWDFAAVLDSTGGNRIYQNTFMNNKGRKMGGSSDHISGGSGSFFQSSEPVKYVWNGTKLTGYMGNYYDDYTGKDSNGDGIGDTAYTADAGTDKYPLVLPFSNYVEGQENETIPEDSWFQFHGKVDHLGYFESGPKTNRTEWVSEDIDAISSSSPVIAGGKVFIVCGPGSMGGSTDDIPQLVALDESSGNIIWKVSIPEAVYGSWASPAYDNGMVFTATGPELGCYNAKTGEKLWSFDDTLGSKGVVGSGPAIADGKVIFNDWDGGYYYCLDEYTGDLLWSFKVKGDAQSVPAYVDGKFYLTSWEYGSSYQGHAYCVDAATGKQLWHTNNVVESFCGSPAYEDGIIYLTTYSFYGNGELLALNAVDGKMIWRQTIERTDSTPAFAYGNVYVCGGASGYSNLQTYCFNATTGSPVWSTPSKTTDEGGIGGWTCSVAVADGLVYVGSEGTGYFGYENLYALDAFTGDVIWNAPYAGSSPALSDGMLFSIGGDQKVYAFKDSSISPVVNFTANVTSGEVPLTIQFNDTSSGSPTSWAWDFENDGVVDSTEQTPVYTYATAGNYTVNLTVANAGGSDSEVKTEYIVVSEPLPGAPIANFTATPTYGNAPLTVNFTDASTGNISSYLWDFDDDGVVDSNEQSPSYTYSAPGTYTVNLTVIGPGGSDSEVKTGYINVTGPSGVKPVAAFSASPTSGTAPLTVTFTDNSEGTPATWNWDFGDGATSTEQSPVHTYSKAGKYTVGLTVENAAGSNSTSKSSYINVVTLKVPVAAFSAKPTSGKAPLAVTFTDKSTGGPASWKWNFGDGNTSIEQNPVYTYSKAGQYTVKLTVKNAKGSSTTSKSKYINVANPLNPPSAGFSASPASGKAPLTVNFTDKSTNSPASWKWTFGDGTSSTEQNPVHTYSKVGEYTVKLTVKNSAGSSTTSKSSYIKVKNPFIAPTAAFSAKPASGKVPLTVTFTDKSTNSPTSWTWTFGDGTSSTEQNPVHIYSKAGKYTVKLKVKNPAGSSTKTLSKYIVVSKK